METLRKGASVLPLPPPLTVERRFSSFRNYVTIVHVSSSSPSSLFMTFSIELQLQP